jgi:hypothetical protein
MVFILSGISVDELCVGRRWCWRFFVMVHSGVSAGDS